VSCSRLSSSRVDGRWIERKRYTEFVKPDDWPLTVTVFLEKMIPVWASRLHVSESTTPEQPLVDQAVKHATLGLDDLVDAIKERFVVMISLFACHTSMSDLRSF